MPYTKLPQSEENVFPQRQNGVVDQQRVPDVRQDKRAFARARTATPQPASTQNLLRAHASKKKGTRSQTRSTPKRRTAQLTLWVNPIVKAEIQRIAQREAMSVSAAGSAFLEQAVQQHVDMHYSALLQPIITQAIRKEMQGISTKLAWLLVRVAFDSGQTRNLVTNILGRQQGVTPDMLKTILEHSGKSAKGNITRKTPQLTDLMAMVQNWLTADGEEVNARA